MDRPTAPPPTQCPACREELYVTHLRCPACGTEVSGAFSPGRLINLTEPHASLLELFIRVRGNVKEMERELGISYPTVRARLDEAFAAARPKLTSGAPSPPVPPPATSPAALRAERARILDLLEQGDINAPEAARRLRDLNPPAKEHLRDL